MTIESKKTAIITGATSGFGKVIFNHLIKRNYHVIVLARSKSKFDSLVNGLQNKTSTTSLIQCNLDSIESINQACNELKETCNSIELLILNAGIWNNSYKESVDGIEETLAVNLIAPYLIFEKINSLLNTEESKVIFTSSGLHQGTIDFDDINQKINFSGFKAYRQSKLGVILITKLLAENEKFNHIHFYAVHPGMVRTKLGASAGWLSRMIFKLMGSSIEKGARTHLSLIDTEKDGLTNGGYYADSKLTASSKESCDLEMAKKLLKELNKYL